MKKYLIIFVLVFNLSIDCNSQVTNSNEKIYKTEQKLIIGFSKQFPTLTLGVSFQKNIIVNDTTYYINFQATTSNSEERKYIYLDKNNCVVFTSKTGKSVTLLINDKTKFDEKDAYENNKISLTSSLFYTSTFSLKVTKEELIQIGSEPFYKLLLTYNDAQDKTMMTASFYSPKFYIRRSFLQKDIKYLLNL